MRQALRIPATGDGTRAALEAFDRFRQACGLQSGQAWELGVALDEVLANVVGHGGAGAAAAFVDVAFELLHGVLEVSVTDDGPPFDPLSLPPPDTEAPLEARQPGGLGVYLTRRLVDRMSYERMDGANRVSFARRAAPAE